jgi:hypothetical protein
MRRACATLFLLASFPGCALSHERVAIVASPERDAGPVATDVGVAPDAGSCTMFWQSLPACPASTASVVGAPCDREGATCGVHCCEPGPAIACTGGVWVGATPDPNCAADCAASTPCGPGWCAPNRVCVQTDEPVTTGLGRCVEPPAPIRSCGAVPAGTLTSDPRTCLSCRCADQPTGPVITLSCDCCDL